MSFQNIRKEVMKTLEKNIDSFIDTFLIPAEKIWQPTDFLPNSQKDSFIEEIKEITPIRKFLKPRQNSMLSLLFRLIF